MPGKLSYQHPLARHTSWHVGGKAERFYQPCHVQDLSEFLSKQSTHEPLFWLGLGSNVLIRDGGIPGTTIATLGCLNQLQETEGVIRAEAGVTCAKLAKYGAQKGHEQAAFFSGIPGTIGGALTMNAGAWGSETWSYVVAFETMDASGNRYTHAPSACTVGYRHVVLPEQHWFIAGHFQFAQGNSLLANQLIKQYLKQRAQTQPIGSFNCGSVFRNPPGDSAGRLIESAGLKGYRMGGAQVSPHHANFITNDRTATAKEIENLIEYIQYRIEKQYHIHLIPEVHRVGVF